MGWRKIAEAATPEASALAPFRGFAGRILSPSLVGELAMGGYRQALYDPCNGFCQTSVV
jgi:hypothetical protein